MLETFLLSDLFKKSHHTPHQDFIIAQNYITKRLENVPAVSSEFNNRIRFVKRILPFSFLCKLLYRLHYDSLIGFHLHNNNREVYGMVSFQKHPYQLMVGMFDIYMSSDFSNISKNFSALLYDLVLKFRAEGYKYVQCGHNETSRKLLRIFSKLSQRYHWNCTVDVENTRIYL